MLRLFIALDLPENRCGRLEAVASDDLNARWTPAQQYHLTLRFLGDVDEETTANLQQRLGEIDFPSFTLAGEGLDVFPSKRRPRVLVARIGETAGLMALQARIDRLTLQLGSERDRKPFNPHITVARFKKASPREVRSYLKKHTGFTIEPFTVRTFRLYKSDLSPSGSVHTVLRDYPLR